MMVDTLHLGAAGFLENAQSGPATALLFAISDARKVAIPRSGYAIGKFAAAKALATKFRSRNGFSNRVAVLNAIA